MIELFWQYDDPNVINVYQFCQDVCEYVKVEQSRYRKLLGATRVITKETAKKFKDITNEIDKGNITKAKEFAKQGQQYSDKCNVQLSNVSQFREEEQMEEPDLEGVLQQNNDVSQRDEVMMYVESKKRNNITWNAFYEKEIKNIKGYSNGESLRVSYNKWKKQKTQHTT